MRIRRLVAWAAVASALVGIASMATLVTHAAMTATLQHNGNSAAAGSVSLRDNDQGSAMLSLSGAALGASDTSCIRVTSDGSLDSSVRHYADVTGALAPYLNLTVTRGSGASTFDSCAGFAPDQTNYTGAGAGVIYNGKLSRFPTSYGAGLVDPATTPAIPAYPSSVLATSGLVSYWRLGDTTTTVSSDDFTGSNGTTLQLHTGETGASWTKAASTTTDAALTDQNRIRRTAGDAAMYYSSGAPPSADYSVQGKIRVQSIVAGDAAGVVGRFDTASPSDNYYLARYSTDGAAWQLFRVSAGTGTVIGSYAQTLTAGSDYTVKLDMQGSTIRLLVDGTERVSVTDTAIAAAGRGGVRLGYGGAPNVVTNGAGLHLDDFRVTRSATAAGDSKGSNGGTLSGGVAIGASGAFPGDADKAFQFDGTDDYVRVNRQIQDDLSIELWFKSTQGSGTNAQWWGNAGLVDAEVGGAGNDFGTSLRSDGKVVAGSGTPDSSIVSDDGYNDGEWHHLVFTRTRSTGAMKLYLDGQLAGTATGPTSSLTGPANIDFGRIQSGTNYFAGSLDEVAVYDTALGAATVESHFADATDPEPWTNGESHDYRLQITVANDGAAVAKSATANFRWEARNR